MTFLKEFSLRKNRLLWGSIFLLSLITVSIACNFVFQASMRNSFSKWILVGHYRNVFWHGWLETFFISVTALLLSCFLGALIVTARRSSLKSLRLLTLLIIEVIRGTPLLTQILFFFYVVAHGIGLQSRLATGILILSFFSSVYIAELIRGSIEVIPKPQWESAKAIGLTTFQTYRYVILPQALRPLLPSLAGQLASLIKDSSLLSIIGISELTLAAQQVNAATYCTLESFFPLALGYLILTLPISLASRLLEKKLIL
ncbi:MAG: amino acid ABC transporter permease [Verrucomicrobiae bacterium]|jgi:polar amino acid transport system permease protein|nr:amino acid ABC transporter permease [Verrucomicrobiae bacterium]